MDSSGVHLWLVLFKAYRALERYALGSIEPLMGVSDFAVLELLRHRGRHPVNEIGRRINLTSGAITSAVDRLEAGGLVVRSFDPNDRRTRIVSLTPKGTALIRKAFAQHKRAMDGIAAGLTRVERESLIEILKKLGKAVEHEQAQRDD
jgi:MarR family transcriptional regulator, 2-MHQ and catechol-resistance regulon repressor